MPTRGFVAFKKVKKMLRALAPGHSIEDKTHLRWIRFNGRCVKVSKGPHGSGENYDIKIGQVRGIVTQLGLDLEEAKKHIPQLR